MEDAVPWRPRTNNVALTLEHRPAEQREAVLDEKQTKHKYNRLQP